MLQDVTLTMKRQARTQVNYLEQQVQEMEKCLHEIKTSLAYTEELGACAVRGVSQRGLAEHLARNAVKIGKGLQALELIADLTEAAEAE